MHSANKTGRCMIFGKQDRDEILKLHLRKLNINEKIYDWKMPFYETESLNNAVAF